MHIFRSLEEITGKGTNAVATVGNFDGVHLGHREIFRKVKGAARSIGGISVVITFVPHPMKVLFPERSPRLINTYPEKEILIEASGIDWLVCLPFDSSLASMAADEFVRRVLVERIGIRRLIIGYDYAFGRDRAGNAAMLSVMGQQHGFTVEVLQPIGNGGDVYSSSRVRRMISEGDVAGVVPLLGRHFSVGGRVVPGAKRGRRLGFPTANLETEKELIPAKGVYAVKVRLDDTMYDGACSVGTNPTFGGSEVSIEVFLFDFHGDLYGCEMRTFFISRIRGEKKFESAEALSAAIAADIEECRRVLKGAQVIEYREYLEMM